VAKSIYHQNYLNSFESVIKVLGNQLHNDVHFLWGLSKDFGASGFRCAILYTQNKQLLQSLANLNMFASVSNPMQMIIAEILVDDRFIDGFFEGARNQLAYSYDICVRKLEEMVVPYVPTQAGLCIYIDFSGLLPEPTFAGEQKFASLIQDVAKVVMTPGQCQHDHKPGMFRLCYTWVTPEVLEIAMERLSYVVLKIRRNHWDNLLSGNWKNEFISQSTSRVLRLSSANLSDLAHYNSS